MPHDRLALDRGTIRAVDEKSGHLHVNQTPISKANICPYFGNEIPDWEELGLKPDQTYQLLRDPEELAKAAASFNGKPLMLIHKPQSAADHDREVVVGSVANPVWDAPFLKADLAVWDGESIELIENGQQRQLSCGYFYRLDLTPGTYEGERYDGRMTDIVGNHVALVDEGRAGPDVFVGDSIPAIPNKPETVLMAKSATALSRRALVANGAKRNRLQLAEDIKKTRLDVRAKVAKLAQDADLEDVITLLDTLDNATDELGDVPPVDPAVDTDIPDEAMDGDAEMMEKVRAILGPDADETKCKALCDLMKPAAGIDAAPEMKPDDKASPFPEKKPEVTKAAMDAALAANSKAVEASTVARMNAIHDAVRDVRPWVGELAVSFESPFAVYKMALDGMGIDIAGIDDPKALRLVLGAQPKPGDAKPVKSRVAMDAASNKEFETRFPGASRLKQH